MACSTCKRATRSETKQDVRNSRHIAPLHHTQPVARWLLSLSHPALHCFHSPPGPSLLDVGLVFAALSALRLSGVDLRLCPVASARTPSFFSTRPPARHGCGVHTYTNVIWNIHCTNKQKKKNEGISEIGGGGGGLLQHRKASKLEAWSLDRGMHRSTGIRRNKHNPSNQPIWSLRSSRSPDSVHGPFANADLYIHDITSRHVVMSCMPGSRHTLTTIYRLRVTKVVIAAASAAAAAAASPAAAFFAEPQDAKANPNPDGLAGCA